MLCVKKRHSYIRDGARSKCLWCSRVRTNRRTPSGLLCVNTGERFTSTREIVQLLVRRGRRDIGRSQVRAAIRDGRRLEGLLFATVENFANRSGPVGQGGGRPCPGIPGPAGNLAKGALLNNQNPIQLSGESAGSAGRRGS